MQIITQLDSKLQGKTRFFTGIPCKNNHIAERLVSKGECCTCKMIREKASKGKLAYNKNRYETKKAHILALAKAKYDITGPNVTYQASWRQDNADRIRQYRKDNAGLFAFHAANRRSWTRAATPPWADMEAIKAFYVEAARLTIETGIKHEVDHIIPLRHKLVCGLHCPANLRVITSAENRIKNNKFKSSELLLNRDELFRISTVVQQYSREEHRNPNRP